MSLIQRSFANHPRSFFNTPSLFDEDEDFFQMAVPDFARGFGNMMMNRPSLQDWFNHEQESAGQCEVKETEQGLAVALKAPGFNKDEIKIDLQDNQLTISGEKKVESEEEDGNFKSRSFQSQSFSRSFTVPEDQYDIEKIQAKLDEGVLQLAVPKLEQLQHQEKRNIPIE